MTDKELVKPATDEEIAGWTADRNTPEALFARIRELQALSDKYEFVRKEHGRVCGELLDVDKQNAELRARVEKYEGLILRHESEAQGSGEGAVESCSALDDEARAIRARKESK